MFRINTSTKTLILHGVVEPLYKYLTPGTLVITGVDDQKLDEKVRVEKNDKTISLDGIELKLNRIPKEDFKIYGYIVYYYDDDDKFNFQEVMLRYIDGKWELEEFNFKSLLFEKMNDKLDFAKQELKSIVTSLKSNVSTFEVMEGELKFVKQNNKLASDKLAVQRINNDCGLKGNELASNVSALQTTTDNEKTDKIETNDPVQDRERTQDVSTTEVTNDGEIATIKSLLLMLLKLVTFIIIKFKGI